VERALFLSRLSLPLPDGYQRLYFGTEFCHRAFPSAEEVRRAMGACRAVGWHFTLVLPVLIESALQQMSLVLHALVAEWLPGDELMISDFGALALAAEHAPQVTVILGRTLSGQKRGTLSAEQQLNAEQTQYFRHCRWESAEAVTFLREQGIERIELDNLLQGIAPLNAKLRASLHLPWAMVTSSRICPFYHSVNGCGPCGEVFTLRAPDSSVPLWQGGNSQFLKNENLPADPASLGIDRLVHHPHLPR
jgi:hypothetical protein